MYDKRIKINLDPFVVFRLFPSPNVPMLNIGRGGVELDPESIDARVRAGETWVTLAGVAFRVVMRRYGGERRVALRTVEGKAYRLASTKPGLEGLTYVHDVTIKDVNYHVHTAPSDSAVTKRLMRVPVNGPAGAPAILVAIETGETFAVRRTPVLDGRSENLKREDETLISEKFLEWAKSYAATRGVTLRSVIDDLLETGKRRKETVAKHKAKKAPPFRPPSKPMKPVK